jgi:hypothetical protein
MPAAYTTSPVRKIDSRETFSQSPQRARVRDRSLAGEVLMWRNFSLFVVPLGIIFAAACSSSSNNGAPGPSDASSTTGDATVMCNSQPCAPGEICCFGSIQASCSVATKCPGTILTCSGKSGCPSGQSCCFAFADGGAMALGAQMFTTRCLSSCPSDQYELCDTTADCTNGGFCTPGQYTTYCAVPSDAGFPGFPEGGFPPFPPADAPAGDAPATVVDAAGAQDAPAAE